MRTRHAAALLLVLALSSIVAAAPPSYPLRVRGGGGLRTNIVKSRNPSLVWLTVDFVPAPRRALRPGEGSWLDRTLRGGEPARLDFETTLHEARELRSFLRGPANIVTFECFNSNKGYLLATKVRSRSVPID